LVEATVFGILMEMPSDKGFRQRAWIQVFLNKITRLFSSTSTATRKTSSQYVSPVMAGPIHNATARLLSAFWSWQVVGWITTALWGFGLVMLGLAFTPMGVKALLAAKILLVAGGAFLCIALIKWVKASEGSLTQKCVEGIIAGLVVLLIVAGELWLVYWVNGYVVHQPELRVGNPPIQQPPIVPPIAPSILTAEPTRPKAPDSSHKLGRKEPTPAIPEAGILQSEPCRITATITTLIVARVYSRGLLPKPPQTEAHYEPNLQELFYD